MKLVTIAVTRSKSCHVKTLHTILKLNILCVQNSVDHQILYCPDDPFDKVSIVERCMKTYDRIFFIDFGIGVDEKSLHKCLEINDSAGLVVLSRQRHGREGVDDGPEDRGETGEEKDKITTTHVRVSQGARS